MENYAHLIKVDPKTKILKIYRVLNSGETEFLTEKSLDGICAESSWDDFESLARELGENVLMDSPAARKLLSL